MESYSSESSRENPKKPAAGDVTIEEPKQDTAISSPSPNGWTDNRPESALQLALQRMANNSPQARYADYIHRIANQKDRAPLQTKPVLQRVVTPDVPDMSQIPEPNWKNLWGTTEDTVKRDQFYRNFLLTLKWQLVTNRQKDSPAMGLVNSMLEVPEGKIKPEHLQQLIIKVKALTPGAKNSPPQQAEQLNPEEEGNFNSIIDSAIAAIDQVISHADAIPKAFGEAGKDQAIAKYGEIKTQLSGWKNDVKTRVQINRSPNSGYSAFNMGLNKGDEATLMLGDTFFAAKDPLDLQGTLVHEASHGKLGTTDIAYMNASYFTRLSPNMALNNADHYKYALLLAHGKDPVAAAAGGAAGSKLVKLFQQSMSLCYYKLSKIWPILMWLGDRYGGQDRLIHADTQELHESHMELGGESVKFKKELGPIAKERTDMLREVIDTVKGYTNTPVTFAENGTKVTVKPIDTQWPELEFETAGATQPDALARIIFVDLLTKEVQFTSEQSTKLFNWTDELFRNAIKDETHRKPYYIFDEDMQLHNLLSTAI